MTSQLRQRIQFLGSTLVVTFCNMCVAAGNGPTDDIVPISATASSTQCDSKAVKNLLDGSGLSESPPGSGVWVHTSDAFRDRGVERGTMWCSGAIKDQKETTPTLTFDFGKLRTIGSFRVWNYNEANWTAAGFKDVDVTASLDNAKYVPLGTALFEQAPGDDGCEGQFVSLKQPVKARFFRLHCLSNWQGERSGLAEIRFFASGASDKDAIAPGVQPVIRPLVKNRPNPPRPAVAGAENIIFPANSGVIDVTAAPYNAKGDGVTDDTRAIQQALRDYPARGAIIYLPNGTYLLSRPLQWGADQR